MPKRLTPSELTKLIDDSLRTLDPTAAEFSPSRQGELKFRGYNIRGQKIVVGTPAHDQDPNEADFSKQLLTLNMLPLDAVKNAALAHQGKTVFIPLAECRNGRQHWTLLVREANGSWHFYDPKAAGWSCGLFSCLSYQLYDTSHFVSMLGTNDIDLHYTGIQSLLNREICGYVVAHLITCLAQDQSLIDAKRSFKIADYLPKASATTETDALLDPPQSRYGTAVAAVADGDSDDDYALVGSDGGINNDDALEKKNCCAIM